jgi:drug/metabolite transporter (DMT)-like permease
MSSKTADKNLVTYLFLTFAMMCWGLSFVWYKQALLHFGPVSLVLSRLIVSLPLVFVSALLLKRLKKIHPGDIPVFLLLAFLEPFLYFIGESIGMQYVSSTVAAILISTIPIFIAISAYIIFSEKLSLNNYLGFAISFAGVIIVILADMDKMEATYKGILFILLAVLSAVGYGLVVKRIANKYNSLTIVSAQNFIAIIYFIPVYFIFEHKATITTEWTFDKLVPMLYLAVFASTFAYIGFIQGLRKLGVSKATVFTNFIPVFTAIFAMIILHESLSGLKVSGIMLVVGGLVLTQAGSFKRKPKPEDNIVNELY